MPDSSYPAEDLAWFAETYRDDPWMVHVTGMDDCHVRVNPELADDDPGNPLLTEETARRLAADVHEAGMQASEALCVVVEAAGAGEHRVQVHASTLDQAHALTRAILGEETAR